MSHWRPGIESTVGHKLRDRSCYLFRTIPFGAFGVYLSRNILWMDLHGIRRINTRHRLST